MAIGPLNIELPPLPQLNVGDYVPDAIMAGKRTPLIPNQPRAASALQNKYAADSYLQKLIDSGSYAPHAINALRNYDQDRVRRGQAPLSEKETTAALQAATTKEPVIEPAKRSLYNLPSNFRGDLTDILKSIPRLPMALFNEVKELPKIGEHIADAENPIAGIASAPGIRMLPGAFTVEQIASGTPGNLLRHPLFTGLDLLPIANTAAKGTAVARRAAELADDFARVGGETLPGIANQRLARRPLKTALIKTLDDEGNIIDNAVGELNEAVKLTKAGQFASKVWGQQSRDAMMALNIGAQNVRDIFGGRLDVPNDVLAPFGKEAGEFNGKLTELGLADRMPEMVDNLEQSNWNVDGPMREGMEMVRDFQGRVATVLAEQNLLSMFDGEVYDLKQGMKLKTKKAELDTTRRNVEQRGRLEASMVDGTVVDPVSTVSTVLSHLRSGASGLTLEHNVMIRQLRNAGYDTKALSEAFNHVKGRIGKVGKKGVRAKSYEMNPELYETALKEVLDKPDSLPKLVMTPIDDAITKLKSLVRDEKAGPGARDVIFGIENRNWTAITKGIEQLRRTDVFADEALINRIKEIRDTGKFVDTKFGQYTEKTLAKQTADFEKRASEAVPARFLPDLERRTHAAAKQKFIDINTPEQAAEITRLADQGLWEKIPNWDKTIYRKIQREAAGQWQALRNQGFDPVYVHTVAPNKAASALHPYASIVPRTASAVKKRAWDMTPGVRNVSVAINHQMMEFISRQQIELSIKQIMDQMGETELSLHERYMPAAERRAASNPMFDSKGHVQKIIAEKYIKFDPAESGYSWGSPYLDKLQKDQVFIPKAVAENLQSVAHPKRLMGGLLDPFTNVFRAATVSLSLRTQLYNLMGGAISLEGNNPGALMRSWTKAREMMKDPAHVPDALKPFVGSTKNQLMDLNREALSAMNEGVYFHLRNKTLNRLWDAEQAAKKPGRPITRFKNGLHGFMEKSYNLNSKVDDYYRMSAYIDTYDTAIRKGSNIADAERKAVTAVRENMQDYLSMTPIERSVIRSIIPFYGFMGHAMRFVLRYPFDHPLRTEMMSKLAMAEMEDQQHLPGRFMSMLFMGGLGPNGEQTAINAGPFNPFGDIANFMSVSGLLGASNPVIQTLLQQAGIENGEAELYPSLRYDPATGRLAAQGSNPLLNMLHNTLPQAQVITAMLGINEEFKDMAVRDPAAASRYLASGLTIPMAWRQINVDQEVMKAELARQDAATKVKNEALKSGDWSEALMYPSLAEYLDAIEGMTPEQRAPYMQLTDDQISALTQPQKYGSVQLPNFQDVEPLDMTVDSLIKASQSSPLLAANMQGRTMPGSSLTNTAGGT